MLKMLEKKYVLHVESTCSMGQTTIGIAELSLEIFLSGEGENVRCEVYAYSDAHALEDVGQKRLPHT